MGRLVIERVVPLPKYLAALEILLGSTRQAGLGPQHGAVLVQQAVQAVVTLAENEPVPQSGAQPSAECAAQQATLTGLDPVAFPNVRAAAVPLSTPPDLDTYYRLGIDMIIGGMQTIACEATAASDRG